MWCNGWHGTTPTFLASASHQCLSAGSSLSWGLTLYAAFSEARRQGFAPGTPVSSPPSSDYGSANKAKLKAIRFQLRQTQ